MTNRNEVHNDIEDAVVIAEERFARDRNAPVSNNTPFGNAPFGQLLPIQVGDYKLPDFEPRCMVCCLFVSSSHIRGQIQRVNPNKVNLQGQFQCPRCNSRSMFRGMFQVERDVPFLEITYSDGKWYREPVIGPVTRIRQYLKRRFRRKG